MAKRTEPVSDATAILGGCVGVPAVIAFAIYMIATAGPSKEERRASDSKFAAEYELKERNARYACSEWGNAKACEEIDDHAQLARHYRERASEDR